LPVAAENSDTKPLGKFQKSTPYCWYLLHTTIILAVINNLLSGLRVASLNRQEVLAYSSLLPQGNVHIWHYYGAALLTSLLISYALYRFWIYCNNQTSGLYGKFGNNSLTVRARQKNSDIEIPALNFSNPAEISEQPTRVRPDQFSASFHRYLRLFGLAVIFFCISTGLLLPTQLLPHHVVVDIHYYFALLIIVYIVLHVGSYFVLLGVRAFKYIFLPIFNLATHRRKTDIAFTLIFVFFTGAVFSVFELFKSKTLTAHRISDHQWIDIDGRANEPLWQQATPLQITTVEGANFENGETDLTVRALYNSADFYLHITWEDSTESLRHLPLEKRQGGWSVLHNGYEVFDERDYYEDKFAIMLAKNCKLSAAGTAHLGPTPLKDKPRHWTGKGYHYTKQGVVDLWHWKATRTNRMFQADDNFIGKPDPIRPGHKRYKAGYKTDAAESGGYTMNWEWFQKDFVTPKRLVNDLSVLNYYQPDAYLQAMPSQHQLLNNHSTVQNSGRPEWVLPWFETSTYDAASDDIPLGTLMPSVLYKSNRFEGDRADVRAHGIWENGRWSLELFRKVDTESAHDISISHNICLWFSAFDHAQIAHTRHHRPVRLLMEE